MKKIIFVVILFVVLFSCPFYVSAKNKDWEITKELCKQYHKPIKVISGYSKKNSYILSHRKGKKYILVEKVISRSAGKDFGYEIDGDYHIAYNKNVKKGKKVVSYIIYNFNSNEPDEILFVVDNGKYR